MIKKAESDNKVSMLPVEYSLLTVRHHVVTPVADDGGKVFIYYESSRTWMHVTTTTNEKPAGNAFGAPEDAERTQLCAIQRDEMVSANLKTAAEQYPETLF